MSDGSQNPSPRSASPNKSGENSGESSGISSGENGGHNGGQAFDRDALARIVLGETAQTPDPHTVPSNSASSTPTLSSARTDSNAGSPQNGVQTADIMHGDQLTHRESHGPAEIQHAAPLVPPPAQSIRSERDTAADSPTIQSTDPSTQRNPAGRLRPPKCPACGGKVRWQPGEERLVCNHCGTEMQRPLNPQRVGITAVTWKDHIDSLDESEIDNDLIQAQCHGCGAGLDLTSETTIPDCPFCGSSMTLDENAHERLRPAAVVPFHLSRQSARDKVTRWLKNQWLAPKDLHENHQLDRLVGVYRVHWWFRSDAQAQWSAKGSGSRKGGTHTEKVEQVVPAVMDDSLRPEKVSLRMPQAYDPAFIAGFASERYDHPPEDAWPGARDEMNHWLVKRIKVKQRVEEMSDFSLSTEFRDVSFISVLVPVWQGTVRWKNHTIRLVIDGTSGRIASDPIPKSPIKVLIVTLLILGVFGFVAFQIFGQVIMMLISILT